MSLISSKSTFVTVLLALLVVQLGFGAYGVLVTKFVKTAHVDPLVFCLIRDGGCFPVLFLAAYVAEGKILWPLKRDWPLLISFGLIGMFLNQLMYLLGVLYTTPDIASIFQPIVPVWTVVVAVILRVEPVPKLTTKIGLAKVVGILLAVTGAILMNFGKQSSLNIQDDKTNDNSVLGYIALILNTLSISVYVVLQKKFIFNVPSSRWREHPLCLTAWSYLFGFLSMATASLYYVNQPEKFHIHSLEVVYAFIYAVFITSALCYMLITWCNMLVSATLVTASWPLQVFFCIILSYFVLGEKLSVYESIGGILIIVAMFFVVWSNYRTEITSLNRYQSEERINSDKSEKDRLLQRPS